MVWLSRTRKFVGKSSEVIDCVLTSSSLSSLLLGDPAFSWTSFLCLFLHTKTYILARLALGVEDYVFGFSTEDWISVIPDGEAFLSLVLDPL